MAIPHTMEEEGGNNSAVGHGGNEDLDLTVAVPEDVQAVMNAAEDGDAPSLLTAGEDGDRPLHVACLYGHLACVQILLTAGASIEVRDEDGGLPLHDACAGGYNEIVSIMLRAASSQQQRKCVMDSFDIDRDTELLESIIKRNPQYFMRRSPYSRSDHSEPSLCIMARGNHSDVVQLLLESGANPKISNLVGQCPADLADPNSPAQVRLNDAVEKLNADATET